MAKPEFAEQRLSTGAAHTWDARAFYSGGLQNDLSTPRQRRDNASISPAPASVQRHNATTRRLVACADCEFAPDHSRRPAPLHHPRRSFLQLHHRTALQKGKELGSLYHSAIRNHHHKHCRRRRRRRLHFATLPQSTSSSVVRRPSSVAAALSSSSFVPRSIGRSVTDESYE
mgnify:CR=1 FL=1